MPESRSALVRLCSLVQETFARGQPTQAEIQSISSLLGSVPLSDLGLRASGKGTAANAKSAPLSQNGAIQHLYPEAWPTITYLHIHECEAYSLGIFCIPKNAVIPLHDHPEMTVFSRLLYGDMHVKAFDVVPDAESTEMNFTGLPQVTARLTRNVVLHGPSPPTVLYPRSGGNIHEFTALTDCAVLDVLAPPYCHDEGRDCTYYEELGIPSMTTDSRIAILQSLPEPPEQLEVVRGMYTGVKVHPDNPKTNDTSDSAHSMEQLSLE